MSIQASHTDEWLNKAFELAFFLHGDRETAKQITLGAMAKLETASTAQFKRMYYTPTGRAETSRATRSRVSLNDLQLLQRLVFIESENFEREHENGKNVCEKKLLTYFIKHLVRISLKRNSFYVTLAMSRILHNYATVEAMEIYNVVVQNPDRVHDDYYYRSRKGVLMKELKTRFGDLLDVVRVNRGEERFQTSDTSDDLNDAARTCLKFFTPWNSSCAIPDEFDPFDDVIKSFHFDKDDPDAEHRIEVSRIHAALHPHCFDRLTDALNLPLPIEKMEIPKFMITANPAGTDHNDWGNPPPLDTNELETIKSILAAQAESRRSMSSNLLRVMVDEHQRAMVTLDEADAVSFDLDPGAELLEVRSVGEAGESILATHLLSFDDLEKGIHYHTATLEGGQKVTFNLTPSVDADGEISALNCRIQYSETLWHKRSLLGLRRVRRAVGRFFDAGASVLKPAMAFGLILLVLTAAWFVYRNRSEDQAGIAPIDAGDQNREIGLPPLPLPDNNVNKEEKTTAVQDQAPKLKERDQIVPKQVENEQKPRPLIKKEKEAPVVPQRELRAINLERSNDKDLTDENGILRLPIRESNNVFHSERVETRGTGKKRGKSLDEITQIYIETTGDMAVGKQISDQIADTIQRSGVFAVTSDRDKADAALKLYIRHESDGDMPEDASFTVIARLVNARGFIIYPDRKGVSGWKYVGTSPRLPGRIGNDLVRAANERRSKKENKR